MPEIPRVGPGNVIPLRRVNQLDVGSGAGDVAYGQAADTLGAISARLAAAEQQGNVASALAGASNELDQSLLEIDQNPDHDAREGLFANARDSIVKKYREGIRGQQAQTDFDTRMTSIAGRQLVTVRDGVNKRRLDIARGGTIEAVDALFAQAEKERDPDVRAAKIEAANQSIDSAEALGAFTATEAANHRTTFEGRLRQADERQALAGVREAIRANPVQALRDLNDPTSPLASGLDEYQRQVAIDQAVSDYHSLLANDRAAVNFNQAQRDRQEAEIGENAVKYLDDQLANNDPAFRETLEEARPYLSPKEYRFYLTRVSKGGGLSDPGDHTDPDTYSALWTDAKNGVPIAKKADEMYRSGRLKQSDRDSLIKDSESTRFKPAEDYLVEKLGVGIATDNFTGRSLKAEALREFTLWKRTNPEATPAQADAEARSIGARYSLVNLNEMSVSIGAPKFGVGERDAYDIPATKAATRQHYLRANGLTGAEPPEEQSRILSGDAAYTDELARINQWNDIQTQKAIDEADAKRKATSGNK